MSACLSQVFYVSPERAYLPAPQVVMIAVKDLKTGAVHPVHVEVYVPWKVKEVLHARGIPVTFKTKIEIALEIVPKLQGFNIKGIIFDT